MNFFSVFMAVFSLLGAADRILGNRFGLGEQFEKGFHLFGAAALSMIGMIILSPLIADLLKPACVFLSDTLRVEPSILPAALFANDMGGATLAAQMATTPEMGRFNGLIVSSMMGVTVSFTIPVALTMVQKEQQEDLLFGFLCGVITVPIGCLAGGLMLGIPFLTVMLDLLPLIAFSVILSCGLIFCPKVCIKIFQVLGLLLRGIVTFGLALGILQVLTGLSPLKGLDSFHAGAMICVNACVVCSGALPFLHILSKLLARPLKWLGTRLGITPTSAMGFISSLATSVTTYGMMSVMDRRGVVLNGAFAISAAFTFAGHLAFTMAIDGSVIVPMIVSKLCAGILAVLLAALLLRRTDNHQINPINNTQEVS